MKAEERKKLETNALADALGHALDRAKQGPSRSTVWVLVFIGLAVLLWFTWSYFASSAAESASARWAQLDRLAGFAELEQFAKQNKDDNQGKVAQLKMALILLKDGLLFFQAPDETARKRARSNLEEAAKLFDTVAEKSGKLPDVQRQALLGAGKAYEALQNFDKAKRNYELLTTKTNENTAEGQEAATALKALANPAALEAFYKDL